MGVPLRSTPIPRLDVRQKRFNMRFLTKRPRFRWDISLLLIAGIIPTAVWLLGQTIVDPFSQIIGAIGIASLATAVFILSLKKEPEGH